MGLDFALGALLLFAGGALEDDDDDVPNPGDAGIPDGAIIGALLGGGVLALLGGGSAIMDGPTIAFGAGASRLTGVPHLAMGAFAASFGVKVGLGLVFARAVECFGSRLNFALLSLSSSSIRRSCVSRSACLCMWIWAFLFAISKCLKLLSGSCLAGACDGSSGQSLVSITQAVASRYLSPKPGEPRAELPPSAD